ncbi:MAG: hypothetical protein J5J04_15275 [Anaerolineae bacterium]|nr:hypothetical protein [Chloroflexota bacterium]MBV6438030.1 hypothetical protein [Anaerolineae bacterium]MDL1915251.1 hypothetical protein [Anaerolineae bacterium CFX4]OQY81194.1 MAG: hypothetical protein B6D42_11730 [Anaerolineae bacterium UTCFX5]MCO6445438.1 hypothetical protein [Anaerolineae bacterium]
MRLRVWIAVLVLMLMAAGCQSGPQTREPIGTVTRPDLVGLIDWERSPLAVVFRAEVTAADVDAFERRNDVADCTIYGDNRVVYTPPGGLSGPVVFQSVSDEAIRVFVEELTLIYQFYNRSSGLDALAPENRPPFIETLLLVVNGQAHRADALGALPDGYYRDVTERCRAVADSPAELIPAAGYVSVRPITYNPERPSVEWQHSDLLNLAALNPDERVWISGEGAQELWRLLRTYGSDVQITQGETTLQAAVEAPGVTRFSPPRP